MGLGTTTILDSNHAIIMSADSYFSQQAKKYAVPALEKHCVDFLKHNLSPDNACMLLTQARLFDEPQLAALCLETIDKYTQVDTII